MVVINVSYTAPINPPGSTPHLSPSTVWDGLVDKVRHGDRYVRIITDCTVLSETGSPAVGDHTVTREVTFVPGVAVPGGGVGGKAREVCKLFAPVRVDFVQADGTTIGNFVSVGSEGELYLTYVFEWRVEGVEEGSEEVRVRREGYEKVSFVFFSLSFFCG